MKKVKKRERDREQREASEFLSGEVRAAARRLIAPLADLLRGGFDQRPAPLGSRAVGEAHHGVFDIRQRSTSLPSSNAPEETFLNGFSEVGSKPGVAQPSQNPL